ncbi:uncharacterized protein LOC122016430 [Zingiber officinale]|uniref:uncharacterized protein LOC122016430 n=1 Tax=Zingiber officinale TaxID=94328 RepID=UPI001C4D34A9|nr:uncharacterized protein LOC122016430 [Zingiber officinale]
MGDHFALLAGRLLTESTLEATVGSKEEDQGREITRNRIAGGESLECRICQEEDEDFNMETPCSCRGSLKFAHRKCVQRWCNEKGDTVCEICLQQFEPGYTAPPRLLQYGTAPMNFRGNWEITRQEDLHDSQILTLAPSEPDDTLHHYDDDHSRSKICCRAIAITFVVLLFLRHCLPPLIGGPEQYSFTLFSLLVLRTAGILLPVVVMVRTVRTLRQCRRHQAAGEIAYSHRIQMH